MRTEALTKTKWIIDKSFCEFGFSVDYLKITRVRGVFREADVVVYTDGNDFLASDVEARIVAASVDTRDEERDSLLKGPEFLDTDNFKHIVFMGKKLEKTRIENRFLLHGVLSIKDTAVPVRFEVGYRGTMKDQWGTEKVGFFITGRINRSDFNLNWNETLESGTVLISDEVSVSCEIQLMRSETDLSD